MSTEEKTLLNVDGMTCSNCALGISRFLEKKGLNDVDVNFSSGEVTFKAIDQDELPAIVRGIQQLGYKVIDEDQAGDETAIENIFSSLEFKFVICAVLTLPLLLHMFFSWHLLHNPVFQLIICTPVFLIGLSYFGKSAWSSLKTGIPNMDVLITTGSSAAFIYSIAGMVIHYGEPEVSNFLFFETASTIITLVIMGNIIEKRSIKKTTSALKELAAMQPVTANKITINHDQSETVQLIPVSEINKNDCVLIQTGSSIPVDGKIYWGSLTVDESVLTGESIPVEKDNGDSIFAGSIVVAGTAKVVTEKAGKQTVLSGIIEMVKAAQQSKPEIQKLGDKVSAWFVPAVLIIALLTLLFSFYLFDISLTKAIMSAVAVLVISCPCAMGLATPTAVAVGLGKAAREGILIKGGSTLELFGNIKTAVFDKTGTLTTGNLKVKELKTYEFDEQNAINIIHSLEQHSSHPIAVSLVQQFENQKTDWVAFHNVEELKGLGIRANDSEGNTYLLGSHNSLKEITSDTSHNVYLSINNKLVATLDLTDELKPGAVNMISELKKQGITPVILSGDNEKRCKEIADIVKINEVYFSKLPHEKTEIILKLKEKGGLMMVGDGVNDAPSLASADIGLSFGDATKIAINSAQVIILNNKDLSIILNALRIGKLTLQTIKQNLFWAFAYNFIAIPIAAAGFLSPMVAAFSMAFSDVVVIGNSIRLKFRK